jgi:hypothetical protein
MTAGEASQERTQRVDLRIGPLRLRIGVLIYAIIVSLASLAVYDEPDVPIDLRSGFGVLLVVVAPVAALAVAHLFAEAAHEQLVLGRTPRWADVRPLVQVNAQFLLVGITVIVLVPIAMALGLTVDTTVDVLMIIKVAVLFGLGTVIAQRTHTRGGFRALITLGYGIIGLVIVFLELILGH